MSTYNASMRLPSSDVSKSFVLELEAYILSKASNQPIDEEGHFQPRFTVTIQDSVGSETLQSINEYRRDLFPNDTQALSLKYHSWQGPILEISVKFTVNGIGTSVEASAEGEDAKEIASGIAEEIRKHVRDNQNFNWFHHSSFEMVPVLLLICSTLFIPSAIAGVFVPSSTRVVSVYIFLLLCPLSMTLIAIRQMSPYSVFDTRLNQRRAEHKRWIKYGLLGVLIFGGLSKLIWG